MRPAVALTALLLILSAAAADWSADSAGGPLTLVEDVEAAFALWTEAGAPAAALVPDSAAALFRYAPADSFGPDTVTLTLQRPAAEPALELVVNPELQPDWPGALVHEAGLVLGLSAADSGVMQPLLQQDGPDEPQEADITRLLSSVNAVPGDLTGDGVVDFLDLLELAAAFGNRGVNLPADLDSDGTVTREDLRLLRDNYVFSEPVDRAAAAESAEQNEGTEPGEQPETEGEPDPANNSP